MSKLCSSILLLFILLFPFALQAQTKDGQPPVFALLAVTSAPLESKTAAAGQQLTLRAISEVLVNKEVVIPVGSTIVGRVEAVATKGKGAEQTSISVVIEKAIRPDGKEVALQTIIAAVAAPQESKAPSTAPIATINLQGGVDGPFMLSPDSQGAIGYEGLSLKWQFTGPLPLTVFATKSKEVKLKPRTQLLLRMAQPQLPR